MVEVEVRSSEGMSISSEADRTDKVGLAIGEVIQSSSICRKERDWSDKR